MAARGRITGLARRLVRPPRTIRGRLAVLYGVLFLLSGAVLLALAYGGTSARATVQATVSRGFGGGSSAALPQPIGPTGPAGLPVSILVSHQRIADLHQLLLASLIALALMAAGSVVLGWLVAGRALRPLRTMTATTREISELNLHQRLGLEGPRDELKELGDTIDGLLERLEGAFDAQRRFVANASHELRTPLTVSRALLEMILSDPDATLESFRITCRQALDAGEQQEQLIDALLMLARSQRGLDQREPVDLVGVVGEVLGRHGPPAAARGVRIDASLASATCLGDPRLLERLVSNLVENALRHNVANGRVGVVVQERGGRAILKVSNTGPAVPADQIERLLQPFQRAAAERVGELGGLGLGLSIVAAIAAAHGADLSLQPGPDGGLEVEVSFPGVGDGGA